MQDVRQDHLFRVRHSFSHVMAEAVRELFPDAKLAIGPAIDDGFYYDFDLPRALTGEDLAVLEEKMRAIVAGKHPFTKKVISRAEARKLFGGQPYKLSSSRSFPKGRRSPPIRRTLSRTSAGVLTWRIPLNCGRTPSSSRRLPALTGAGMRRTRCCSASTARRGIRRRTWTRT